MKRLFRKKNIEKPPEVEEVEDETEITEIYNGEALPRSATVAFFSHRYCGKSLLLYSLLIGKACGLLSENTRGLIMDESNLGTSCLFDLQKIPSQPDYDEVIPYYVKSSNIILLTYSVQYGTLDDTERYYYSCIMPHKLDESKVIVVATQADEQHWTISEAQGKEFARKIRAPFVLTSSITNVGIDELRNMIIQVKIG